MKKKYILALILLVECIYFYFCAYIYRWLTVTLVKSNSAEDFEPQASTLVTVYCNNMYSAYSSPALYCDSLFIMKLICDSLVLIFKWCLPNWRV